MISETESVFFSAPSMSLIKKKDDAIKTVITKLEITTLVRFSSDDMFNSVFNQDSFPGFSYKKYLGFSTKREAIEIASYVAKKR